MNANNSIGWSLPANSLRKTASLLIIVLLLLVVVASAAEGGNPRTVISDIDCEVAHVVWNQTKEDVSGLSGYLVTESPNGDTITTTLSFDKYSGTTAHFTGPSPWNGEDGTYTVVEGAVGNRVIDNVPYTVDLYCGQPTATPTVTGTSVPPTPTPTAKDPTPTPTPSPSSTPEPPGVYTLYLPFGARPEPPPPTPTPTMTPTVTPVPPTPTPQPETHESCSRIDLHMWGGTVPEWGTYELVEVPSGRLLMEWHAPPGEQDSGEYVGQDEEGWTHFTISSPTVWAKVVWTPDSTGVGEMLKLVNHVPENEYYLSLWDGGCHAAEVIH